MNNVYQRPLFMQQGGSTRPMLPSPPQGMMGRAAPPMAPPMPRQAMAPPMPRPQAPPMAPPGPRPAGPMAPPGGGAPDMAGIASMISQKAKADISQAQGPEEIINAFRGNQRPLQARYQELAQYVGPQDATATPVSVLTMIQPSLMMTADGAAQSGIGELMAGITSDVAMEEAPGVPSRMGQGVGELMMAGQPPQPAGMAHGGIVKKFREGGSSLRDYYNEDLATYQDIMAPTDADRRTAKQSMLMDISSRALANAGGAGADKNIAGQVADIFQTLPSNYAAYQNQLRQGEGATRQAALQSASGRVAADRATAIKRAELLYEQGLLDKSDMQKFIYDSTIKAQEAATDAIAAQAGVDADIAEATAENEREVEAARLLAKAELGSTTPIMAQWFDKDGVVLSSAFNIADPVQLAEAQALGNNGPFIGAALLEAKNVDAFAPAPSSARGTTKPVRLKMLDGTFRTFNESDPNDAAGLLAAVEAGGLRVDPDVPDADDAPSMNPAQITGVFADADLIESLKTDKITPAELTRLNTAIAAKTRPRSQGTGNFGPDGAETMQTIAGEQLSQQWNRAIREAQARGIEVESPSYFEEVPKTPSSTNLSTSIFDPEEYETLVNNGVTEPLSATQITEIKETGLPDLGTSITSAAKEYPIDKLFGTWASLDRTANTFFPAILGILGPDAASFGSASQAEANAEQGLSAFHTLIVESMLAARPGRASNETRQVLERLLPTTNSFFTNKTDAIGKYGALLGEMQDDVNRVKGYLNQNLSQTDRQKYDFIQRELQNRVKELQTIYSQLEGSTTSQTSPADFQAIFEQTTSVPYPTSP